MVVFVFLNLVSYETKSLKENFVMKYVLFVFVMLLILPSLCLAQEGYIFFYDFNADQIGKAPSGAWKPTVEGKRNRQ